MNIKKYSVSITAAASMFMLFIALWCEVAYYSASIGFLTILTYRNMASALLNTDWDHIRNVNDSILPMYGISVIGTLAAIVIGFTQWRPSLWIVAIYTSILLVLRSWMGLFVLLYLPFMFPLDGEFMAEGMARMGACGIWSVILLVYLTRNFMKHLRPSANNPSPAN